MDSKGVYRVRQKESSFEESLQKRLSEDNPKIQLSPQMVQRDSGSYDIFFWVAVLISQIVGIAAVILVAYWCMEYGGFAWESNADLQFNFHPLLMVLGLVFLYGDAIIVYRVLHFVPKWILKIVHASLHLGAIIASAVGLAAVLENHRRTDKADFYSLHSWVGIATYAAFCLQYVIGFIAFFVPGVALFIRAMVMPFHIFFGLGLFVTAVATAEMGLTEKLLWTGNYTTNQYPSQGVIGNCIGLLIIIFAFLVVFLSVQSKYKRKPLPSEVAPSPSS